MKAAIKGILNSPPRRITALRRPKATIEDAAKPVFNQALLKPA